MAPRAIHALAATPLVWVAWFYLYVVRQRLLLGFWPTPAHPDPKEAGYCIHHLSLYLGALAVPMVSIVLVGWILRRSRQDRAYRWQVAVALHVFALAAFMGVLFLDPGDFWGWFRD